MPKARRTCPGCGKIRKLSEFPLETTGICGWCFRKRMSEDRKRRKEFAKASSRSLPSPTRRV